MAVKTISYQNSQIRIGYDSLSNGANKNIVFLHGWGSNKELMRLAFSRCFKEFNHIYVDLPGFGTSRDSIFFDTADCGGMVGTFLDKVKVDGVPGAEIVVGHSYGGKVALLLQREAILLSSAGILLPKALKTRAKIVLAKAMKAMGVKSRILLSDDSKGLSPAMYEVFKRVVNEDFSKHYGAFVQEASVFWGEEDGATPVESFEMIKRLMPNARFFLMKGDHYFFLKQGELVERLYMSRQEATLKE